MIAALSPVHPVLVVDDEPRALQSLTALLRLDGITNVLRCGDSREVMGLLAEHDVEVVLLDLSMPYLSGQDLLPKIAEEWPEIPVIVVTGLNDLDTAVSCMRRGAFDYMVKPVEQSRLISGVKRAIELRDLRSEFALLKERMLAHELERPEAFGSILTASEKMHGLFRFTETISRTARPVLITGETGVGKELLARAVHMLSGRAGEFVAVNVAGLDDEAFSDTLFGHVRGAFTGAEQPRSGLVERAAKGTVFLDEIGDLGAQSQVKLLRLLQERDYYPLGSDVPKQADARVIVATHRDIEAMAAEGLFRKDLYYRLQVHRIHIPPLRERPEDVPVLLAHYLKTASIALNKKAPAPPRELLALLQTYAFPGNVRELEAMVFEAVARHDSGRLSMAHFKTHIQRGRGTAATPGAENVEGGAPLTLRPGMFPTLGEATAFLVAEALRQSDNNQSLAAELLGITPSALNKRLKRAREK